MDGLANCFGYMVMAFQDVMTNVGRSVEKTYSAAPVISYLLCDSVHTCGDMMDAFIKRCFYTIGALKTNRIVYPCGIRQKVIA